MTLRGALPWGLAALLALAAGTFVATRSHEDASCGPGFVAASARCCPVEAAGAGAGCDLPATCPPPLVPVTGGCDAPDDRVTVPETTVLVGPSDWEAEGRVAPRTIHVRAFRLDAFEATQRKVSGVSRDGARAANRLSRDEASAYCGARGGRLPTEDEWTAAAVGSSARRYPWGETGAVCRRAAWGLASGPCSSRGAGPDTVGAHPDGDTPSGLHDMAGNVAEWVAPAATSAAAVACGGSWASSLASELRTWAHLEVDPAVHDPRLGVRCAYDAPP